MTWQILSGASNMSGNGLSNVTAFQIFACSGQVSLVSPVLNWVAQSVWVLSVRAFIQNAVYVVYPQVRSEAGGGEGEGR